MVSLREAVDVVEKSSHRTRSVTVLPPATGDSAVDSDSEKVPDGAVENIPLEPAGQMEVNLKATCNSESDSENENDKKDQPAPERRPTKKQKIIHSPKWSRMAAFSQGLNSPPNNSKKMSDEYPFLIPLSPYQVWKLFFNNSMLQQIVQQIVGLLYAHREKNVKKFAVGEDKVRRFIGIALLSGHHTVLSNRDYWSNQPDLGVQFVSQAMTCRRY